MATELSEIGPTFDREAYLATVAPPVFVAGGLRHIGRVLSWEEWLPLEALFESANGGQMDRRGTARLVRAVCDTMFPPPAQPPWPVRLGRALRRVLGATGRALWPVLSVSDARAQSRAPTSVYEAVRQLPFAGQLEAIKGFAARQAEVQYGPRLTPPSGPAAAVPAAIPTPMTHGSSSPA